MLSQYSVAEQTYSRHLPTLKVWAGWFVLVRDDRLGGVFETYQAAVVAWMTMYGPVPALIRRIEPPTAALADTGVATADPLESLTTIPPTHVQGCTMWLAPPEPATPAKRYVA